MRAGHAALVAVSNCPLRRHRARERPLSFGARPWCNVQATASNAKPAQLVTRRTRTRAHCVWAEGAALGFAVRARHAALVVVGPCDTAGRCASERPLSFGARQWCEVPAAASSAKPAPLIMQRKSAGAHCLWGGGAPIKVAVRAGHDVLIAVSSCPLQRHCARGRPLSFAVRPWCNVPAAASSAKPAPLVMQRTCAGARCL